MVSSRSFTQIPCLDLSLSATAQKPALLNQLRHAVTDVGFLYVSNHEVPEKVVIDMTDALPVFFSLPAVAKREIDLVNSPHFLGYSGSGAEKTAGIQDHREQVEFATELSNIWAEDDPFYERLRGPNQWPSAYRELREVVGRYMQEMTLLGERFLALVAEALFLPPESFARFLSDQHRLKMLHYPATSPDTGTNGTTQGVGPHKDSSGWWTFLLQASQPHVKGLQVLNPKGEWINVPIIPGTFVVNIGQAFEVITHGVCKATIHRVLSSGHQRFSVPFFQGVRRNLTKSEALDTFREHFAEPRWHNAETAEEAKLIDSPFLEGKYDTWGESQLRTKIRSHRDVGEIFYSQVYEKYIRDDV